MPDLPSPAERAPIELPVDNHARPDPFSHRDAHEVPEPMPGPVQVFGQGQGIHVVFHPHREAEAVRQGLPHRHVVPTEDRGVQVHSVGVDEPGDGHPDPDDPAAGQPLDRVPHKGKHLIGHGRSGQGGASQRRVMRPAKSTRAARTRSRSTLTPMPWA